MSLNKKVVEAVVRIDEILDEKEKQDVPRELLAMYVEAVARGLWVMLQKTPTGYSIEVSEDKRLDKFV